MAASFWQSSQAAQLQTKDAVAAAHAKDHAKGLSVAELDLLTNYYIGYIRELAKAGYKHGIRQRVAATACVFFRRFYLRNDFCDVDARGVAPAALYLAAKVEESLLSARHLFQLMQKLMGQYPGMLPVLDIKVLIDLEMALLEDLDFNLTVWHPYTDLAAFLADAQLTDVSQTAWSVLNDSYCTSACLLYPPHITALGCLNVAAAIAQKDMRRWMEGLDVDLEQVYGATLEVTRAYESARLPPPGDAIGKLVSRLKG